MFSVHTTGSPLQVRPQVWMLLAWRAGSARRSFRQSTTQARLNVQQKERLDAEQKAQLQAQSTRPVRLEAGILVMDSIQNFLRASRMLEPARQDIRANQGSHSINATRYI